MIGFLIALVSGALMSIQGVFNTQVTKSTGIWTASAFVQFTALLVCLGAWLCTERTSFLKIAQVEPRWFGVEKQPWEWRKAIGMAVAIVGIVIFKWK